MTRCCATPSAFSLDRVRSCWCTDRSSSLPVTPSGMRGSGRLGAFGASRLPPRRSLLSKLPASRSGRWPARGAWPPRAPPPRPAPLPSSPTVVTSAITRRRGVPRRARGRARGHGHPHGRQSGTRPVRGKDHGHGCHLHRLATHPDHGRSHGCCRPGGHRGPGTHQHPGCHRHGRHDGHPGPGTHQHHGCRHGRHDAHPAPGSHRWIRGRHRDPFHGRLDAPSRPRDAPPSRVPPRSSRRSSRPR